MAILWSSILHPSLSSTLSNCFLYYFLTINTWIVNSSDLIGRCYARSRARPNINRTSQLHKSTENPVTACQKQDRGRDQDCSLLWYCTMISPLLGKENIAQDGKDQDDDCDDQTNVLFTTSGCRCAWTRWRWQWTVNYTNQHWLEHLSCLFRVANILRIRFHVSIMSLSKRNQSTSGETETDRQAQKTNRQTPFYNVHRMDR